MPSIYVHDKFARDISKVDKLNIGDVSYFRAFSQSFDHLFSYNVLNPKRGKKYRKLGHYAHTHKVWEYFKNIIVYMKENNIYTDECLAYLYGSICHYTLDSIAHPYVHYISGRYSKKYDKETKKYIGNHAKNEIMLDAIFYLNENKGPYYIFKMYKELFPNITMTEELNKVMDYAYKQTFNFDNMGDIYFKAYKYNRKIYRVLMFDRFGIKKICYKIADIFTPYKKYKAYNYSHHIKNIDKSVLNVERNTWHHPVTNEKHNESFMDLYNEAVETAKKRIKIIDKYFHDKCSLKEVENVVGNISYSSGLDCDLRVKFSYFKN